MWFKSVNGERVALTPEEVAEIRTEWEKWEGGAGNRAADEARRTRNRLLMESDWTQLEDAPAQIRAAFKPYRQALRDLPQKQGFPLSVEFPSPPNSGG